LQLEEPEKEIHKKELIGRRAFGKDKEIFSESNGHKHYKIKLFTDTRPGGLSVDRLGIGEANMKRVPFLDQLGLEMGEKRNKDFRGWAQLSVTSIYELVVATEADGEVNPFHAEILRDEHPTDRSRRSLAFELCELARLQGFLESPSFEKPSP